MKNCERIANLALAGSLLFTRIIVTIPPVLTISGFQFDRFLRLDGFFWGVMGMIKDVREQFV